MLIHIVHTLHLILLFYLPSDGKFQPENQQVFESRAAL